MGNCYIQKGCWRFWVKMIHSPGQSYSSKFEIDSSETTWASKLVWNFCWHSEVVSMNCYIQVLWVQIQSNIDICFPDLGKWWHPIFWLFNLCSSVHGRHFVRFFLHRWSHGGGEFPCCVDDGMGITMQMDLVFFRKASYAIKPVRVLCSQVINTWNLVPYEAWAFCGAGMGGCKGAGLSCVSVVMVNRQSVWPEHIIFYYCLRRGGKTCGMCLAQFRSMMQIATSVWRPIHSLLYIVRKKVWWFSLTKCNFLLNPFYKRWQKFVIWLFVQNFGSRLKSLVSILKSFSVVLCKYDSNDVWVVEKNLFIYLCMNVGILGISSKYFLHTVHVFGSSQDLQYISI